MKAEMASIADTSKLVKVETPEAPVPPGKTKRSKKSSPVDVEVKSFYTLESINAVYHIGVSQQRFTIGNIIGHVKLRPLAPKFILEILSQAQSLGFSELRNMPIPCIQYGTDVLFQIDGNHRLPVIALLGLVLTASLSLTDTRV